MPNDCEIWADRADQAQHSLDAIYGAPWPQFLSNWSPSYPGSDDVFNYWWLAHVIDVRLDAYERTGDGRWLDQARLARRNLVERNGGGLVNEYFDDMAWFGLALERLSRLAADPAARDDAIQLWQYCRERGWNDTCGPSMAWRTEQPDYKNTPANGPFAILGARLFQATNDAVFLRYSQDAFEWITRTLTGPDGFVEDGINRLGDGAIDRQWRFTYNQGLYIGAGTALAAATGQTSYLDRVGPTVRTALSALTADEVFASEGSGGDEGLFKGIFYRYALSYLRQRPDNQLAAFIGTSAECLWLRGHDAQGRFHPGNDWRQAPVGAVPYSTHLSAIMAVEAMAALAG